MSESIADFGLRISDWKDRGLCLPAVPQSAWFDFAQHRELAERLRNPQSSGFTLLEVLLAMAILAIIVAAIYGSFATAGRSVEQAEQVRDSADLARTLLGRLTTDIENAWCSDVKGTHFFGKKEEAEVEGKKLRKDSLSLSTRTNWRRPGTKEMDLWSVGYFFREKPDGSGHVLMRKERRSLEIVNNVLPEETEYEVTDQVTSLRLRYTSDGRSWQDDLGGAETCMRPAAAEVTLVMADGTAYRTLVKRADY